MSRWFTIHLGVRINRFFAIGLCGIVLFLIGCSGESKSDQSNPSSSSKGFNQSSGRTLAEARKGWTTQPQMIAEEKTPLPNPPGNLFLKGTYNSPIGKLAAYLSPNPNDGKKHPLIIWITGGDCNSIDDGCWTEGPPNNEQSASAYRKAGLLMMFPSLRGGNQNPGRKEGFYGEVDDVIAAAEYIAKIPYVDPNRIYLGGHSTGGTMVLLASELSNKFRAVFSFGPADDVRGYPAEYIPFNTRIENEWKLRSPGYWLHSIQSPTFVLEGTDGNRDSLLKMKKENSNPNAHFFLVEGASHFSILGPINNFLAKKIMQDTGPRCNIQITDAELKQALRSR